MAHKSMQTNIELAHVYSDACIDPNHHISANKAREISRKMDTTSILVDDYNPQTHSLNINNFVYILENSHNIKINFVAFESGLCKSAEKLFCSLPTIKEIHFKRENKTVLFLVTLSDQIPLAVVQNNRIHYRCPLLTASWQLTRLGEFQFENVALSNRSVTPVYSDRVVSILDHKYRVNEERSLAIIEHSPYRKHLDHINHVYI